MNIQKYSGVLVLPILTLLFSGCEAESRTSQSDPVQVHLARYEVAGEQSNQTFQNNKFFLWTTPLEPKTAAKVMIDANKIDANEDDGAAARTAMAKTVADLAAANSALDDTSANLDETSKSALNNWHDLADEFTTTLTDLEASEGIAKTESELNGAGARITKAGRALAPLQSDALVKITRLSMDRAKLPQADAARDTLQRQLDALNKQLPKLKGEVLSAKTAFEALLVTYEGEFRDRARRAELETLLLETRKVFPQLPTATAKAKAAVETLFKKKQDQFQDQYRIGKLGENLVASVINSTNYFENMPERVTFNFHGASSVVITLVGFPEKNLTLSTDNGAITDVDYQPVGGILRFNAHAAASENIYSGGDRYFKFEIARTRPEITDGRLFYQGTMDYYDGARLIQHGVAKLATSN